MARHTAVATNTSHEAAVVLSDCSSSDASGETSITVPDEDEDEDGDAYIDAGDGEDDAGEQQAADDLAELLADNNHSREFYLKQLNTLDGNSFQCEEYAPKSLELLDRVEREWLNFCAYLKKDVKEMYLKVDVVKIYTFFHWSLNQRRGKDGRRRQGLQYKSSLETYWKVFRLVYEREKQEKIDKETSRALVKLFKLSTKGRPKSVVYLDDLTKIVETTVTTTEKKFGHGRLRICLCLYFQLAGFTANRPGALLKVRYQDIQVTLLRDPDGGPNNILIEFTPEFSKTFLGDKDAVTFVIPEIIFDPSLILSPHVMLLGLLFADGAFGRLEGEEVLTSAKQLLDLSIPEGTNELRLPLKPELDDIPVFRKLEQTADGVKVSDTEALTYQTLWRSIRIIGELSTFIQILRAYSLRYGAGKALDNSGQISDAVRSLIFQHSDTRTFLDFYLHKKVDKDLAAIVRGIEPQDNIMRAACRMLRSVHPRRPRCLTTAQASSVNKLPHIEDLIKRRNKLSQSMGRPIAQHKGTHKYTLHQRLNTELATARSRAKAELLRKIQKKFDYEEPLREIQRQLSGIKITEAVNESLGSNEDVPPQQQRLISALLSLPGKNLREEMLRRTEAIDAVAEYCLFEEGDTCKLPRDQRRVAKASTDATVEVKAEVRAPPPPSQRDIALKAVMEDHRPLYCFWCLKGYSVPGGVTKHLRRRHLRHIKPGDRIRCPTCCVDLEDMIQLKNHALIVHKTLP
ncbi:uncharacterized protein GIQ15_04283 [Arthroderma uncinatum]|uniref:uncharacterized protein n=1 Tax=Arthroderma uncinatum TaxID=74035 RepID=UPI00144AF248|nr:uncharacterized protein GIQ15_04283 [Arthroderma uncinatum]KAF3481524.1 hypothetical protein GIQ15_04283 [Arthroderma uncinatum]